jgi:hypothetical protein
MSSFNDRKSLAFPRYSASIPEIGTEAHHPVASEERSGIWKWMLMALHDSRYREAKRFIHHNQHLLSSLADTPTATEAGFSEPGRSPGAKKIAMNIVMAVTIAFFIVAHAFALQEMQAASPIDPSTEILSVYGD